MNPAWGAPQVGRLAAATRRPPTPTLTGTVHRGRWRESELFTRLERDVAEYAEATHPSLP